MNDKKNFTINTPPPPKKRNTIFDLLRTIAILFIILHHLTINNIGLTDMQYGIAAEFKTTYLCSAAVDCFIIIGVNLFFLLSGYFGIKLKYGKILSLVLKIYIYFVLSAIIGMAAGLISFSSVGEALLYMAAAITKYWFAIAYISVILLSPFLNMLVERLTGSAVRYFVFMLFIFTCVAGFAADYVYPVLGTNNGYSPVWACAVYMFGRTIKLHGGALKRCPLFWTVCYILLTALNYTAVALCIAVFENGAIGWHLFSYNNPLVFGGSVAFFMIFYSLKPIENKKIGSALRLFGSHTFGVYLLHSNNPLLPRWRAFLIDLSGQDMLYMKYILLLPNAVAILLVCLFIDVIFDFLLAKPTDKIGTFIERLAVKTYTAVINAFARLIKKNGSPPESRPD